MANDATFIFKIIEQGGGAAGGADTAAGKGGDPMASPQPSQRTQAREEAQTQAGGAQEIVQEAQRKTRDEKRKQPRPKPPKKEPFSPDKQAELFGNAVAQRLGLGGVISAIGTAALPLAAVTAVAGGAFAVFKAGQAISRGQAALAQRVRPFSPDLAISAARENLRITQQNIELARRFGPQLAEAERRRGRFTGAAVGLSAEVAGGPIGEELSSLIELASIEVEVFTKAMQAANSVLGPGPATFINRLRERLGFFPDAPNEITGNLFGRFPHAEVKIFPKELGDRKLGKTGDAAAFTTNQDRILNQF